MVLVFGFDAWQSPLLSGIGIPDLRLVTVRSSVDSSGLLGKMRGMLLSALRGSD